MFSEIFFISTSTSSSVCSENVAYPPAWTTDTQLIEGPISWLDSKDETPWNWGTCTWCLQYSARPIPANTRHSPTAVSMLAHRLRRWPNIETALCECPVFAGIALYCIHTNALYTELDYTQPTGEPY